ncbi:DNA sulfur modification protein DndB [Bacillus sp. X1(2014)]|uniref:DNA sulfur modification protein DndB n=1 Tax=Bacillus sp. X1(2014) TaxID=1565991 RepID=UPI00119FD830|nr:DNA sulfur modification protein DndB [Bacillus sp. X1(2014)]
MNSFKIQTKKLNRKDTEIYIGTATIGEIHSWNLKNFSNQTLNEFIYILSNDMEVTTADENFIVTINDGYLLSILPKAQLEDEFPVLISKKSPITIILNALLEIDLFKSFIEIKTNKISNNSTKIMTLSTLENIISLVFDKITLDETATMLQCFTCYIEDVLNSNESFKVQSVKSIQENKKYTIINSSISWYIILKYFEETYKTNLYTYPSIPRLDFFLSIDDWSGNFFNKDNPIWNEVFITNRKFYPTRNNLVRAFEKWKYFSSSL